MCFLMSNRCHVLIITPVTAGRCLKTASSPGSFCTLWICECVCLGVCVCVCSFFYACMCLLYEPAHVVVCALTCMDLSFMSVYLHSWITHTHCVFVCLCVYTALTHFQFSIRFFFYTQNNLIIHDILGTWKWKTTYFPILFLFLPCCSSLLLHFYLHFPVWLACPRSTEMCEVCVECKWSEEAACCPVTLCGLVTLWLCGVAQTCPLALPINFR